MNPLGVELDLIRTSVGGRHTKRDVIRVFGSDSRSFLQGQLTQDISHLETGKVRWTMILSPKGRVEALVRVWGGNSESEMLLDCPSGMGSVVVERLNRYRMRVKAEVELLDWEILSLYGPQAQSLAGTITAQLREPRPWSESPGMDLLGPTISVPDDLLMVSADLAEAISIADMWPAMSTEVLGVDPAPIPVELGQRVCDLAIDMDKGCYTGQELVARTSSRVAEAPRSLVRVATGDESPLESGTEIDVDDSPAVVTSSAHALDGNGVVALAFRKRGPRP